MINDSCHDRRKCGCDAVKNGILEAEILHQHAITSVIRHQTNWRHCAAANSRYSDQLNRARLGKYVILTSFSKSPEILLQLAKLILMFLLFEEHTWGIDLHKFWDFWSVRLPHVPIQILTVSGCCPWHMDDLGKIFLCGNVLQSDRKKRIESKSQWVMLRITIDSFSAILRQILKLTCLIYRRLVHLYNCRFNLYGSSHFKRILTPFAVPLPVGWYKG